MQNNNIRSENIEKETLEKNIKEVAKAGDISPRHTRAIEESHLKNKGGKSQKIPHKQQDNYQRGKLPQN